MDSINRNQPEDNKKDLISKEAIERIQQMTDEASSCFFCTAEEAGESQGVRPMAVQKADDDGCLWFLSSVDSDKNREIQADPRVRILLQDSKNAGFLMLVGRATVSRDPDRVDDLWNPIMKTWFTEGKDDPRITVIRFQPSSGYYWDNKHGSLVAATKMVIGAAIGKTLDDSIEGRIHP